MKAIALIAVTGFLVFASVGILRWQADGESRRPEQPFAPHLKVFVKNFEGAGEGVEGAGPQKPYSPEESLKHFKVADGLEIELIASEPIIRQPLNLHFDERGRLWVIQYLQYPFPAGLKILKYDRYLRAVLDKTPLPPPNHYRGADKVTILEDTNGDGHFDSSKDFATGLNIATSVAVGRGGVWVLNPPYLLFYPDRDKNDVPDSDPEVRLSGFGLEDTHAVANSLHWGPDGWLYGAQGSTTTANVKGVRFLGQAIWRYHPETYEFELFAEGGGNTWSVEFDKKGRLFSGTNHGATRGLHYAQGGYYIKSFSKHGPLNNPFAFGHLNHMGHTGYQTRFAQTMIVYEGGALPGYEGQIIAGMALTNRMQASKLLSNSSTFKTVDTEAVIQTENRWFRPVDTKIGPDGAVYIADWHDIRLSHLSPRDNWDRGAGRLYRLKAKGSKPTPPFDLAKRSNMELIELLSHKNKWFREQARRVLGDRRDQSLLPELKKLVEENKGQLALEALWAVNVIGGFDDTFALRQLSHLDEYVRYWTVRILGDQRKVSPRIQEKLVTLARSERSAEVRSQLASSCKRWGALQAFPILRELLLRSEDVQDPHIPLLLWWAIEDKASSDRELLLSMLKDRALWRAPMFTTHIAPRLGRRFTAERGEAYYVFSNDYRGVYSGWNTKHDPEITSKNLTTCARLLDLAPDPPTVDLLAHGMAEGLGRDMVNVVPTVLSRQMSQRLTRGLASPALINLGLRLGVTNAQDPALQLLADSRTSEGQRKGLITSLVDARIHAAVPILLDLLRKTESELLQIELLNELQHFEDPKIAKTILDLYRQMDPPVQNVAQDILISRKTWARLLLESVEQGSIPSQGITEGRLSSIKSYNDSRMNELIRKHWERGAGREDLDVTLRIFLRQGERKYKQVCGYCHLSTGKGMRASLVDSKWVLGPEPILARVVLNGKKGEEMEMPPMRHQLDDQQIASILTYIRHKWGHRAPPVDPETVAEARRATATRHEPWTEEELIRLPD